MSQLTDEIATTLKSNGLSITRQRLFILSLLEKRQPLTMHELYNLSKGELDRASLYRIIAAFEKLGIVKRINIGWKYKLELSDKFTAHHHHLTCLNCSKVTPINEGELEGFITKLASSHSFRPLDHQIEVQGYCSNCHVNNHK